MTGSPQTVQSAVVGSLIVYINALLLGTGLMSLEMLGSRYLGPYFGSSIHIWAALISTVLAALSAGYFLGGYIADKFPSLLVLGGIVLLASGYIALIPFFLDEACILVIRMISGTALGSLAASFAILFLPLMGIAIFTPFGVRLLVRGHGSDRPGTATGIMYGISTLGNIFGILFTTFYLMPRYGSRVITYQISLVILISALSFWIYHWANRRKFRSS